MKRVHPAPVSARAPVSAPTTADTLAALGMSLSRSVPGLRVTLCSIHDQRGDVLWLSDGFFGPDEHAAVRGAFERFACAEAPQLVLEDLGDGRCAAILQLPRAAGIFTGAVALLVDARGMRAAGWATHFRSPALTQILHAIAAARAEPAGCASAPAADPAPEPPPRPADGDLPASATSASFEWRRLHRTLCRTEISLHVQQLLSLEAGAGARSFEVLLRAGIGTGRSGGRAPQGLIDRASAAGLGNLLDRRVIIALLDWIALNHGRLGPERPVFSVNVCASSVRDDGFAVFLEAALASRGLPGATLALEVREPVAIGNPVQLVALASRLEQLGCPLIVDDFTGSARAIELLRTRGVAMLKLADDVMADLFASERHHPTIARIVHVARLLRVRTVAKRIEDPRAARVLTALGVEYLQSYTAHLPCAIDAILPPPDAAPRGATPPGPQSCQPPPSA